jgi:hypothetical protein
MPGICGCGTAEGTCCVPGEDRDGDSITDCDEEADGDDWTDPDIFNGMYVRQRNQCSSVGSCSENNTLAEVNACMSGSIQEARNQYSGWDWNNPPDNLCNAGYGFLPPWTVCDSTWQADWQGYIYLHGSGRHCFGITGGTDEGCGSLFFDGATNGIQNGSALCFDRAEGAYPIRWHYTMDNGSNGSLHVNYCNGGASSCTPSVAIPSSLLRVQN